MIHASRKILNSAFCVTCIGEFEPLRDPSWRVLAHAWLVLVRSALPLFHTVAISSSGSCLMPVGRIELPFEDRISIHTAARFPTFVIADP